MSDSIQPDGESPVDPFDDLDSLRLSQDFGTDGLVEEVLTTIDCRKPDSQDFIRVRPGDEWRLETRLFKDNKFGDRYMVDAKLWEHLRDRTWPCLILVAIGRNAGLFLWSINLPSSDGRTNKWNESAMRAATWAEESWVQVRSNMSAGRYTVARAKCEIADPVWPQDYTLRDLLRLCFEDRFIKDIDHPILKALRGEV